MKELAAFLLARVGGKENPTKDDVTKILDSVGIKADEAALNSLFDDISKLQGGVEAAIQSGMAKLAVVPAGGGGGGGGAGGAAAGGAAGGAAAQAEKEEEEEEEESEKGGGGNLFGAEDEESEEESD